eukprot:CAMPEP_0197444714 /NCGR_PEP_ID=MMETSP1175-20131217/10133_1 /TAXON_ID=1003142 /ORGANISM="Triceratium dubium, Strain CCMP147" /LENGTH=292 /DNA_ID=CAMNT_0042975553 /DNA_START=175 /DNA_END=1053 /DNA_ORIENTATION=+
MPPFANTKSESPESLRDYRMIFSLTSPQHEPQMRQESLPKVRQADANAIPATKNACGEEAHIQGRQGEAAREDAHSGGSDRKAADDDVEGEWRLVVPKKKKKTGHQKQKKMPEKAPRENTPAEETGVVDSNNRFAVLWGYDDDDEVDARSILVRNMPLSDVAEDDNKQLRQEEGASRLSQKSLQPLQSLRDDSISNVERSTKKKKKSSSGWVWRNGRWVRSRFERGVRRFRGLGGFVRPKKHGTSPETSDEKTENLPLRRRGGRQSPPKRRRALDGHRLRELFHVAKAPSRS